MSPSTTLCVSVRLCGLVSQFVAHEHRELHHPILMSNRHYWSQTRQSTLHDRDTNLISLTCSSLQTRSAPDIRSSLLRLSDGNVRAAVRVRCLFSANCNNVASLHAIGLQSQLMATTWGLHCRSDEESGWSDCEALLRAENMRAASQSPALVYRCMRAKRRKKTLRKRRDP